MLSQRHTHNAFMKVAANDKRQDFSYHFSKILYGTTKFALKSFYSVISELTTL